MDPALIGTRLASSAIGPLIKKLLVQEAPGAGLTERRIRLSRLVSFRGEKRTLTERDVRTLAATLVGDSLATPGEQPFPPDEAEVVAAALSRTLLSLGDLDMDDVQAVRLGHRELARRLRTAGPGPDGLSTDAALYLDSVTEWACLHILHFFTQRSTFVARTLVEQSRDQAELIAKVDELIARTPRTDARDGKFERRYLSYVAKKHGRLTIYGIDLHHSPDAWPLDVAYLSLEASVPEREPALGQDQVAGAPEATAAYTRALPPGAKPVLVRHQGHFRDIGHLVPHAAPVSADQALARHDRVLLRGVAGSGKTTLVQWLAVSAARQDLDERMAYLRDRIPFVLPLRTLTRHGGRLPAPDAFLSAVGCPLAGPDGWADRVLAAGRALVLIDGIDEVPEAERERTLRWLRDLLLTYEGNRWLVTSRPSAVRDDWLTPDGFTELTLSAMSTAEVTTFVRRWHQAAGPASESYAQPLLDALRTTKDLALLATNPLMCGLICALHRDRRGYLPHGRRALYEAALSMLLSRRDRERDMGAPYGVELGEAPQIQLIQRLAHWLTVNGRAVMDRSRAESIVRNAAPSIREAAAHDAGAVFAHLLHRSGLLREPGPGQVDFIHRTFQDYLAAKHLVDEWHIGVLAERAADDQWEDVIRMSVAHARPRECAEIFEELMAAADRAKDRSTQLRILVVAATALDHATEVSPAVERALLERTSAVIPPRSADEARQLATVGPLVLDLLPGPDGLTDDEAETVVVTASHIKGDAPLPFLARFTGHASLGVRSQLMWAWGRFDATQYADEIIAHLDPRDLDFTIRADDRAAQIARLGLRPERLDIRRDLSDAGLAALLAGLSPTSLSLERPTAHPDLRPLAALDRLDQLTLTLSPQASWSLDALPVAAPLRRLYFHPRPLGGLAGLARHSRLQDLDLTEAGGLTADDWRELARLPALAELSFRSHGLRSRRPGLTLPTVTRVFLYAEEEDEELQGRLDEVFPSLRQLVVHEG